MLEGSFLRDVDMRRDLMELAVNIANIQNAKNPKRSVKTGYKNIDKAKQIAPKRTGFMANNILVEPVKKTATSVTGTVNANADYSSFVEFGTYKMSAQPFIRPAVSDGQSVFIKTTIDKLKEVAKFK